MKKFIAAVFVSMIWATSAPADDGQSIKIKFDGDAPTAVLATQNGELSYKISAKSKPDYVCRLAGYAGAMRSETSKATVDEPMVTLSEDQPIPTPKTAGKYFDNKYISKLTCLKKTAGSQTGNASPQKQSDNNVKPNEQQPQKKRWNGPNIHIGAGIPIRIPGTSGSINLGAGGVLH